MAWELRRGLSAPIAERVEWLRGSQALAAAGKVAKMNKTDKGSCCKNVVVGRQRTQSLTGNSRGLRVLCSAMTPNKDSINPVWVRSFVICIELGSG